MSDGAMFRGWPPNAGTKPEGQVKCRSSIVSWRDRSNIVVPRFLHAQRRITRERVLERVPTASNVGWRDVTWVTTGRKEWDSAAAARKDDDCVDDPATSH